ncbi:hypothetical protein CFC21_049977 [Triticum aestivum]|uniref:F-box domain-containing protein n=2 Tax=Triticum aestivum TaxID=4565 RepID=A0A3B6H285_WHEAT|nr:hypothetical protein CFC21_049977 [Triticum aestivum]
MTINTYELALTGDTSGSKASSAQINHHHAGTDIPQVAENMKQQTLFDKLPEDILHRIHSLLPIQDAACAACVSHAFLRSWRCYSKLILNDCALGLNHIEFEERKIYLIDKVDKILKNHHDKGVKVETLNLILTPCTNIKASYLDRWLRRTVKSGFKDLYLEMPLSMKKIYKFPCSVLSDEGAASSIQFLKIGSCTFHPTSTLGSLARLKTVRLSFVHTTEEGLEHLFSKSSTLEELRIFACHGIICLKIPCTMQHLKILDVQLCNMLRVVEIDAPNLCYFNYDSALPEIYVRNCSQLKHVQLSSARSSGVLFYARTSLPSIARNVESLILVGRSENANTPLLQSKLPHLKNLEIRLRAVLPKGSPPSYDFFSLVSFLDASPALESFTLHVNEYVMKHYPVVGDNYECPRQKLDLSHNRLRHMTITGFCSAKSLVELTVHILESTHSLERLTLDTTYDYNRCIQGPGTIGKCTTSSRIAKCWPMSKRGVDEAHRAVKTVGRYIAGRVPLAVQFELMGPCSRCRYHTGSR